MPKLPRVTPTKVLKALLRAGFYIHHQTGSHVNLRPHTKLHLHVVIPRHGGDLAPETLKKRFTLEVRRSYLESAASILEKSFHPLAHL